MPNNTIQFVSIDTPIGAMLAAATKDGICILEFFESNKPAHNLGEIAAKLNLEISESYNTHLDQLKSQLTEYFEGKRREFNISLAFYGTDFQKSVWQMLIKTRFGTTKTYRQQAEELNQSKAIRAVANTNGLNKILILVPCHRILGSNGKLTGYSGEIWRKKWLLNHERNLSPIKGTLF